MLSFSLCCPVGHGLLYSSPLCGVLSSMDHSAAQLFMQAKLRGLLCQTGAMLRLCVGVNRDIELFLLCLLSLEVVR